MQSPYNIEMQFFAVLSSTIETHSLFLLLSWSLTAVILLDAVKAAFIQPSLLLRISPALLCTTSLFWPPLSPHA